MPRRHQFPSPRPQGALQLNNFLGVDLTNPKNEVAFNRSPDASNLVLSHSGALTKRLGIDKYSTPSTWIYSAIVDAQRRPRPVWGVYTYDIEITSPLTATRRIMVAFVGKDDTYHGATFNIWYLYNSTWTMLTGDYTYARLIQIDTNKFVIMGNAYARPTLLLFSGSGVGTTYDLSDKTIGSYETYVYTPTTHIGRSPNGLSTNEYEQINLLSQYQINTFLGDGETASFVCSDTVNTADTKVWVKSGETWVLKTVTTHYTINTSTKTITFTAGNIPPVPAVVGEDNVKIQFVNSKKDVTPLYKPSHFGLFGFNNTRNFIFLPGKKEYYMEKKMPLYIGEFNYAEFPGTIVGYASYGEHQTVHCSNDIFIRSSGLDASGEVIFPVKPCVSGVGILNGATLLNYADNPTWVSEFGVTSLASGSLQYQTKPKGFYIYGENMRFDSGIKYETNRFAFVFNDKYYLYNSYDQRFYVADKRYQYNDRDAGGSQQFEWFVIDVPAIRNVIGDVDFSDRFTGACVDDLGYLVLSSTAGIYRFRGEDEYATEKHSDVRYDYSEYDVSNLTPTWANDTTYSKGQIRWDTVTGTLFAFKCIKQHATTTASPILTSNEEYWVRSIFPYTAPYNTNATLYFPVIAVWTTPVLNMGNISVKKTLKNLWVMIERFDYTKVKVYYSTDTGSAKYSLLHTYSGVWFDRDEFADDSDPIVIPVNRQERKFLSIAFKIVSNDRYEFSLLEILLKYTVNSQYKG